VTTSTPLSISPIPTPPLPPIQIVSFPFPLPPLTDLQTFSTFPNQSISIHLILRVLPPPSSPLSKIPRLSSQLNSPHHPTPSPTSLITPSNWTNSQPTTNRISARALRTSLPRHRQSPHPHPPINPMANSLLCLSCPPPAFLPPPILPLTLASLTHYVQSIV
jgi:hypothetical protein